MHVMRGAIATALSCLLVSACSKGESTRLAMSELPDIDAAAVLEHVKVLSSDAFEGRAPGTRGEDLVVQYLVDQYTKLGLEPGNRDGTYIQNVPLVGITTDGAPLVIRKGEHEKRLRWQEDVVAWTKHVAPAAGIRDSAASRRARARNSGSTPWASPGPIWSPASTPTS